ncbi:hypothetical protein J4O73_20435 [Methylobacterium sp. NFXW15]
MSSVSTSSTSQISTQRPPPPPGGGRERMSSTIKSELSSGALSSTDATALTSALDAIDTSLSSSTGTGSTAAASSRLDPGSMKDRIDSLISDQVDSGALTSDQADELKNLFASGGRSTEASSSASGTSEIGGPPPGPPPGGSPDGTTSDGSSSTSGTSSSDLLSTFMQQLQAAQSKNAAYGATGSSQYSVNNSALLIDFRS